MPVEVHHNYKAFQTPSANNLIEFAKAILRKENREEGTLNIIFTDNNEILSLNSRYLKHDYYTDVIAFPYSESGTVDGDIFISLDKVYENSIDYNTGFTNELVRVIVHGILHLTGYSDKTVPERQHMHQLEDRYIEFYFLNFH